jgi:general secretion pathway protein B
MSYILEALKKAEQQRELGRVPGIETLHEQASGRRFDRWLWGILLLLMLNGAVLLVLLWPEQGREMRAASGDAVPPSDSEQVAASPARRQPGAFADPEPAPERASRSALAPVGVPAQPAARATGGATAPESKAPPAAAVVRSTQEPEPVETRAAAEPALPIWPRVPDYLFRQLSSGLRLDVHVYAEQPRERFVLINLRKYQEGDQLQEGPRLDAITGEGVILSFQGERFRVQSQQ